jgi:hypothetical protein
MWRTLVFYFQRLSIKLLIMKQMNRNLSLILKKDAKEERKPVQIHIRL